MDAFLVYPLCALGQWSDIGRQVVGTGMGLGNGKYWAARFIVKLHGAYSLHGTRFPKNMCAYRMPDNVAR
ncbi:hypothetical protein Cenrod_1344 [Candidatus Symbiobacter mobilis CR]|uniref:Uncharacterized protein n=1 Tax=Candidatus Symbiobacter mobilis CR TaxID=946483 RepID=U5N7E2_9BURK|nr:hypothetical protein Cenrod_1344 [Candidatus Symbiobacter mobilis CR]